MNLFYTLDAIKTGQALFPDYKKNTHSFNSIKWWGEYDKNFDVETVEKIIEGFERNRNRYFQLVHRSDYRDTYRGRIDQSTPSVFIKHYRVFEAKYSRTTILKRNLIRRTLAKKSFVLSYVLKNLGIHTLDNLFFAAEKGRYIPENAYYASIEVPGAITLDYYLRYRSSYKDLGSYTREFTPDIPSIPIDTLLFRFGGFCRRVTESGIHIFHKELIANTLIRPTDDDFELLLCDLDIIKAISPMDLRKKENTIEKIGTDLERRFQKFGIDIGVTPFFEGAGYA